MSEAAPQEKPSKKKVLEVVKREGNPDYVTPGSRKLMARATEKAKATFNQLLQALENPQPTYYGFAVKKGFAKPKRAHEHIWLTNLNWDGTQLKGDVNNEPIDTEEVEFGDTVVIKPDEISDWMYIDGDKLIGGYSIRVLYHESSPEEQKAMRQEMGLKIPPIVF